jgi:hypothetical protein
MSGPIVRRYGFPNFDRIFGERPLQHGVDGPEDQEPRPEEAGATTPKRKTSTKGKSTGTKKPKK